MHPSGEYFIFASNKLGFENFELFMVDAAGTKEPVRVTYSDGFDGLPVPSPDGKQLAWTSSRARRTAPGRSSSRSGTTRRRSRRSQTRRREKPEKTAMTHDDRCRALRVCAARRRVSRVAAALARRRHASKTRAHVETLASRRVSRAA